MTDFGKAIQEAKSAIMPFECWEKLPGETGLAYTAFCAFRDLGPERNIRKAVDVSEKDEGKRGKRYGVWRNWAALFRWRERAEDYDRYREKLKQEEIRKTIEAQGEMHRVVTGKMLAAVSRKLDTMKAEDLTQSNVTEWASTAIRIERETAGLAVSNGKVEPKQGELSFTSDFQEL